MTDTTVAKDDARQATHHETVKSQVDGQVNAEIAGEAAVASPEGKGRPTRS